MHPPLIPVGEQDFLQNNSDDPRPAQCPVGGGIQSEPANDGEENRGRNRVGSCGFSIPHATRGPAINAL